MWKAIYWGEPKPYTCSECGWTFTSVHWCAWRSRLDDMDFSRPTTEAEVNWKTKFIN